VLYESWGINPLGEGVENSLFELLKNIFTRFCKFTLRSQINTLRE